MPIDQQYMNWETNLGVNSTIYTFVFCMLKSCSDRLIKEIYFLPLHKRPLFKAYKIVDTVGDYYYYFIPTYISIKQVYEQLP